MEERYLINCINAPNDDSKNDDTKKFFKNIFDDTSYDEYQHILYTGDFNVALNNDIDSSGFLHVNNSLSRQYIKSRITSNGEKEM